MANKTWKEYYFNYQLILANNFYIPLLQRLDININGKKTLDVGCGDGGFITAFSNSGAMSTGIEVKDFKWDEDSKVNFIVADIITNPDILQNKLFDIIILRDVIEHINKDKKDTFITIVSNLLNENGIILITFPPFLSPFGLHQQVFCKSILRYIPFLSLLPWQLLKVLFYIFRENTQSINEMYEVKQSSMKINKFLKIIKKLQLKVTYEEFYFIRPSHELRYGFKVIRTFLGKVPIIRELFVTGTVFILKK